MKPKISLAAAALALAFAAPSLAADAGPAKADTAKGQSVATQVCSSCHAVDGSRGAPANPIIAGQHAEYIAKQLAEFKSGKRHSPIMKGIASQLSDDDMRNVAAFYASRSSKPGFAKSKELVALGERIYRGGLPDRRIAACAGCHSPTGSGIPAQYPRVGGQHGDYTEAQLVAFRAGARANSPQMTTIAAKMTDREIKAVSDYIAGLQP